MNETNESGYVYVLTNPSFLEDWVKIGKSARPVNIRSKELDNTAVPLPFDIFATIKTVKYHEVEKLVHKTIDRLTDLRIRQNREFFNVAPQVALDILNDIAATIDDAVVTTYKDNKPICHKNTKKTNDKPKRKTRRKRFKFSMINVKIGEYVTFIPTNTKVKVASDDSVEYEGRIYKLSPFVGTFMPEEKRNNSGSYQGAKFFSYKGKVLDDLRKTMERKTQAQENIETVSDKEQDHLKKTKPDIAGIYTEIKKYLLSLSEDVTVYPKKKTIGFKIGEIVFCDFTIQCESIRLFINVKKGMLKDPENITRDVSHIGHWGNGDYEIRFPLKDGVEIDYIYFLLRQAIEINKE